MGKPTQTTIDARVSQLIAAFDDYLASFDASPAFTEAQLRYHLETCRLRAEAKSAASAIDNDHFLKALHETLRSWRMQARGAKLIPLPQFVDSIRRNAVKIASFEGWRLDQDSLNARDAADCVWQLIEHLAICDNTSKLVAGTKALHHILPELVVPMDRAFTGAFFGWNNYDWQVAQQRSIRQAFAVFARVARETGARKQVGERWRSSVTKLIDNAVVGFCRKHLLNEASYRRALEARAKELGILDKINAEAERLVNEKLGQWRSGLDAMQQ